MLLPLIAPGIFISLLLVYIPLFTDFASPALVGGTSGYMLGNVVNDLVLEIRRPQPRCRDEHHHAGRCRRCSRSSPTGSARINRLES